MITPNQIQKLKDIVVAESGAEKVYLFGSYAKYSANEQSDVDLLIIINKELNKEVRRSIISKLILKTATKELFFPKDFKVYSINEFERLKNDEFSFLYNILKEAKPLYVK